MRKYKLCEKIVEAPGEALTAYGIITPDGERIDDITFSRDSAQRLVRMLNENEVESCHVRDVIDDFLFEETTLSIKRYGE